MFGYMGKWILKSLVMSVLMLSVSSYLLYLRTGHTPWSLLGINSWSDATTRVAPDLSVDQMAATVARTLQSAKQATLSATDSAADILPDAMTVDSSGATHVYRWVDAQGVTHFGEAPPAGVDAEAIALEPNRNVIGGIQSENEKDNANNDPVTSTQEMVDRINRERNAALSGAGE
ncbi:DUF4124 domain-containing protein [Simiduia aestuariiviva]|uniref:DUF4124 domain-containing protein n=1 Tax=Simiduia aestuariiviva TaxID=1510459 RepID=A0A839USY3_9GAMM|nr:DUF4124 domain-containing protein [Simiduia aestuariiviva]MBB3169056.1 hypothetical protein [Simiduia aestuariiviva]